MSRMSGSSVMGQPARHEEYATKSAQTADEPSTPTVFNVVYEIHKNVTETHRALLGIQAVLCPSPSGPENGEGKNPHKPGLNEILAETNHLAKCVHRLACEVAGHIGEP